MRCECCELPSVFRFDCFVRRRKGAGGNVIAGKCDVFTGEARAHPIGARVCACTCVRVTALGFVSALAAHTHSLARVASWAVRRCS